LKRAAPALTTKELEGEIAKITALTARSSTLSKTLPKYRKGDDTWGGRGSKPTWVKAHLDGGGSLEDLKT
jgi:DNA-binding protein H-NS